MSLPDVATAVAELKEDLWGVRRDLHRHPELAFQEERTARLVAERLRSLGLRVQTGVAQTGVVGLLEGSQPGKTLMLRADIDALPIQEVAGRPHGSTIPGKMHACGHDGHTAVALAVASILAQNRDRLRGRVKFVFQPAEETMAGARRMIDEGVLRDPRPDRVLGFHFWAELPAGTVGTLPGAFWASADDIKLVIQGKSGHGATPHLAVDAIAASAQVVSALQTIVSREVGPFQPAVLTVGTIHGGQAFNIVADRVEMTGTVRAFDEQVRTYILERVREVTATVAAAMRCQGEFVHRNGCPVLKNDPDATRFLLDVATRVVGKSRVVEPERTMVADDVARFLQETPGCYFVVGSANPAKGIGGPHHSPSFDLDEEALPVAAQVLATAALEYLG
ncbi:MAG: amidohydrolase [Chloroflexi bacterium]|nr:amidohydrolase [Chloroflexota bacterium]